MHNPVLSLVLLVLVLLGWVGPLYELVFHSPVPYLYPASVLGRLPLAILHWLAVGVVWWLLDERHVLKRGAPSEPTLQTRWDSWYSTYRAISGLVLVVVMPIMLGSTSLGMLVSLFPSDAYAREFELVDLNRSKYRRLTLELRAPFEEAHYKVRLPSKDWAQPQWRRGDRLLLTGEENLFGIHIQDVTLSPRTP